MFELVSLFYWLKKIIIYLSWYRYSIILYMHYIYNAKTTNKYCRVKCKNHIAYCIETQVWITLSLSNWVDEIKQRTEEVNPNRVTSLLWQQFGTHFHSLFMSFSIHCLCLFTPSYLPLFIYFIFYFLVIDTTTVKFWKIYKK